MDGSPTDMVKDAAPEETPPASSFPQDAARMVNIMNMHKHVIRVFMSDQNLMSNEESNLLHGATLRLTLASVFEMETV